MSADSETAACKKQHNIQKRRTRRAHQKSKTGCKQCRAGRVKCDEKKPACAYCVRHEKSCSFLEKAPQDTFASRSSTLGAGNPSTSIPALRSTRSTDGIPIRPTRGPWMNNPELLDYYASSNMAMTLGDFKCEVIWQIIALKLAVQQPFLMHGILATSAIHPAHQRPEQQEEYAFLAASHINLALPFFSHETMLITAENCPAVFAFSALLVVFAMAPPQQAGRIMCVESSEAQMNSDRLQKVSGGLAIGSKIWQQVALSPLPSSLGSSSFHSDSGHPHITAPLQSSFNLHLVALQSLFSVSMPSSTSKQHEFSIYLRVLDGLQQNFSVPVSPVKPSPHQWVTQLPHEYITFLRERKAGALIILAYYCVLIKRVESSWGMDGLARQLVGAIHESLPDDWICWIRWPLEQVERDSDNVTDCTED